MANERPESTLLYCFTHSSIGTSIQITEKLKDLSQGITNDPPSGQKGSFTNLNNNTVLECVVCDSHVALLLEDGRVCRVKYNEELPMLSSTILPTKEKSDDDGASTSSARSLGSRSTSPRPERDEPPGPPSVSLNHAWGSLLSSGSGQSVAGGPLSGSVRISNRGRILLRRRGSSRGLMARWPVIPASEVPDDLVDQAMAVLQGKSREVVIRELQKTNLDVNQAVNNLLSREDDDGGEGSHDEGGGANIVGLGFPSGEELLSLLSSGLAGVAEDDLEEALGRSRGEDGGGASGGRESRVSLYEFSDPLLQNEIRSLVSLGDGAAGGGSVPSGSSGSGSGESSKRPNPSRVVPNAKRKKENPSGPVLYDNDTDWWEGKTSGVTFKHIAALHSELLAVDSNGKLHGWVWSNRTPSTGPHPIEAELKLTDEKIRLIGAKLTRASVVTESGKLATWTDRSIHDVASRLELKAQHYAELSGETVSSIHVSELVSAIVTETSKIYWWGVLPFSERKQAVMQSQEKIKLFKYHQNSGHTHHEIKEGNHVCLRSSPVYSIGAKAIHIKGTQIVCGTLQEDVMTPTLAEKCPFEVITPAKLATASSSELGSGSTPSSSSSGTAPENKQTVSIPSTVKEEMEVGDQQAPVIIHIGTKRKYSEDACLESAPTFTSAKTTTSKREVWSLRDVIFTDHVTNVRVGSVVKIDGIYAAVHYPAVSDEELAQVSLDNCRLLRKDDLVLSSEAFPQQTPYFTQDTPRRLRFSGHLLSVACDSRGVHALFVIRNQVCYVLFNLSTGKFNQNAQFGDLSSQYLIKMGGPLQLIPINLSLAVVLDKQGGLFPISKNTTGNMRDLPLLNLPPASCVGVGVCSNRNSLVGVVVKKQLLMPAVLKCDYGMVKHTVDGLSKDDSAQLSSALKEHCSGWCNLFHVLGALGKPADPTPTSQGDKRGVAARTTPRGGMLREIMKQAMALASGSAPPPPSMEWSNEEGDDIGDSLCVSDTAADILHLLTSLDGQQDVLTQLLQEKNLEGYTPFMAAVACKAYSIARMLYDLAERLSEGNESVLLSMLYPSDCHPDDNPVLVICRSDTCSFTWTGEEHIQQDIFECRTCGLTGSLCCCTECAYICHRGHDCSFKRSSPTAYCDCWEERKCKALAPGSDYERKSLLSKLLKSTNLGTKVNSSNEYLLGMLASIVARQSKEQSHWSGIRAGSMSYRSSRSNKHEETPVYDLPPPKFAQKALNIVIEDWACVRAALTCGRGVGGGTEEILSGGQRDTASLDAFVYTLLSRLGQKTLDSLLTALVSKMGPQRDNSEAVEVTEMFLRSVVRVFTVCHMEAISVPNSSSLISSTYRKKSSAPSLLVERAQRVFTSLSPLAIKQLVPMCRAIILPVTMGIVRPVDPLCMSDRRKTSEELFRLPPGSLLRVPVCEDEGVEGGGGDTESEMGDGEEEATSVGTLAHDASSTATTGSNLLYLSDQDSSDAEDLDSAADDLSVAESHHDEDCLLDPPIPHRVLLDSHWALPTSRVLHHHHHHHHHHGSSRLSRGGGASSHRDILSMGTSSTLLAQTFSMLIRQLSEVFDSSWSILHSPTPPYVLPILDKDPNDLYQFLWEELNEVWVWLFSCMDMLECQLRFGDSVTRKTHAKDPSSKHETTTEILESRKELFSYILTLLRGQFGEHGHTLPAIDVAGMEHLVWVFDALFYLLQNTRVPPMASESPSQEMGVESTRFFRRSNSTICLGAVPPSPFDPMADALPLAEKPQLMDGIQDKDVLFGYHLSSLIEQWPECPLPSPPLSSLLTSVGGPPSGVYIWPKQSTVKKPPAQSAASLTIDEVCGWDSHKMAASVLVGRWATALEVFSRTFMDTIGRQKGSVLYEQQRFEHREKEFRREMDSLRSNCHREITLEVDRTSNKLLTGFFQRLNGFCAQQAMTMSHGLPPLCVHRIKVTFTNEPGEGSGVLRSLFTATAEALLSEESPPTLDLSQSSINSNGGGKKSKSKEKEKQNQIVKIPSIRRVTLKPLSSSNNDPPLFYQPGKAGFYAPRVATNTPERLSAYRNVGRVIGLCLLNSEVMPLPLCRHIFKYLLKKEIGWHDLAFFDPAMYESLRKTIVESRKPDGVGEKHLASLSLAFAVTLRQEEGGEMQELIPGGGSVTVTTDNMYDYVEKYAKLRMVKINTEPLEHMKDGLHEVLSEHNFSGLSAEDMRLLLCGCPHIDIEILRGITLFDDESHKDQEVQARFKGWFWAVLERMTQRERQDLLYFWTSSPNLPANVESYQPPPSVTIRPPDDIHLPTANTCISRLYLPLYSSKTILRTRLLTAIKTKTFGFV